MKPQQGNNRDSTPRSYKEALKELQIELVKLQRHLIKNNLQILILFEGRDTAGKDGVIKRITQHLSPRDTRVVALGKPSERDKQLWYFQRYAAHLPSKREMVLLNRSWYNRAGVELVMGYCSKAEYESFMRSVLPFEHLLVESGTQILKYYLDISKEEQRDRLKDRRSNPLKMWKTSPVDRAAQRKWNEYSEARDLMLDRTHNEVTPWYIVKANNKKAARLNVIRHIMSSVECPDKDDHKATPESEIVFTYSKEALKSGAIEP